MYVHHLPSTKPMNSECLARLVTKAFFLPKQGHNLYKFKKSNQRQLPSAPHDHS